MQLHAVADSLPWRWFRVRLLALGPESRVGLWIAAMRRRAADTSPETVNPTGRDPDTPPGSPAMDGEYAP